MSSNKDSDIKALLAAYQQAADQMFSIPRSLADGTPVTGRSAEECRLLEKLVSDFASQAGKPGFLGCYEFDQGANPYVAFFVSWHQLLQAQAESMGKHLVFATNNGSMSAKAQLNARSLMFLSPMEFISWGDLTKIRNNKPDLLRKCFILGDIDFEPENTLGALMSSDGLVRKDEIVRCVFGLARDARMHVLFFHRTGWKNAFSLDELAKVTRSEKSGCFIATAACGTPSHPQVEILRSFRDHTLTRSVWGRGILWFYDHFSPPVANWIGRRSFARLVVRLGVVRPAAALVRFFRNDGSGT